ncbi:MAG: putative lipoprotein [Pseudomonas sp.]|jgi:hypothetical protein|nr:putative lipoprotein [Pseudomonas sp.]
MLKIFPKIFLVLAVALLYGCASAPSPDKMQSDLVGYSLPKAAVADKGLVYVVRPSSVGMLVSFNVFLDNQAASSEVGHTGGNEYIYFYVTPGTHTINSKAENWADLKVDVPAGQVVYIKQEVEMGFVMARNSLVKLNDTEGRYLVKGASLGSIAKAAP